MAPAAAVLLGSAFLWAALRRQENSQLAEIARDAATNVENEIVARLDVRLRALERMSTRWTIGPRPERDSWERDASLLVEHGLVNLAIAWVDTTLTVRWLVPRAGNADALGYAFGDEPRRREAASRARAERTVTVTPAVDLLQGGVGIIAFAPIHRGDVFEGYIGGVFAVDDLLANLLANTEPGFGVAVFDDSLALYRRPLADPTDPSWTRTTSIELPGSTWQIRVWPGPGVIERSHSGLPNVTLVSGLLVAILVGAVMQLRRTAESRAYDARASRARYLDLFENAPDMFLSLDIKAGTILECNRAVTEQLGYERYQLIGRPLSEIYTRDILPRVERLREEFKRTGKLRNVELQVRHRDGYPIDISANATAVRNESGEVIESRAVWRDITNLKQTQQALHRSEERLNRALGAARVGTWEWDIVPNQIHWDTYMFPLYGLAGGPVTAEGIRERVHPLDRERAERETKAALDHDETYDTEYRVVWPDGSVHHLSVRGSVIRDSLGRAVRMLGVAWDITARTRAEEAQAAYAAELARSNKELEMFAYVASHDLQEPLRMVSSYTQLLARRYTDKLDDTANEFIDYAVQGAARMQQLINDLLSYSRVQSRGEPLEPVDTNVALRDALADLRLSIEDAHAIVTSDRLPTVRGDRTQLTQLFRNLIANAVKFRSDRPPEIRVCATRTNGAWTFAVRDNGIGIAPQYADRIFEIFQRLHTRQEYPGTGIGLALCKRIVERHGGRIWIESDEGQGATFFFTLEAAEGRIT
jgi:PAS domain S-box-containing protein